MVKIDFKQAREFLDKINEKDNVAIITHNDMDGFCSAKLLFEFCRKKKCANIKIFIVDSGRRELADFDLVDFNKLILADLSPNFVSKYFEENSKGKDILYTDHHPEVLESPIVEKVLELRTTSEGYIPSSRTCFELTEKENASLKWIAALGLMGDMGQLHKVNEKFLNDLFNETGKDIEFYREKMKILNSVIIYYSPDFDKAFEEFSTLEKIGDTDKLDKYNRIVSDEFMRLSSDFAKNHKLFGKIKYYELDTKFPAIKSVLVTVLSSEDPGKVYVFSSPKGNVLSISARNQSREYDTSKIMQDCIVGLKDGRFGGHKVAAGGNFDKADSETFIERLRNYNIKEAKIV